MNVGEACNRSVIFLDQQESAFEAAKLMRQFHVGDVVIVRDTNGKRIPVGIVTDRDLALEIIAQGVDPAAVAALDLVTGERLVTADTDEPLEIALERMRAHGVRRLPVVNSSGVLIGILTADDILDLLTEQLADIVRLVVAQRKREERLR